MCFQYATITFNCAYFFNVIFREMIKYLCGKLKENNNNKYKFKTFAIKWIVAFLHSKYRMTSLKDSFK